MAQLLDYLKSAVADQASDLLIVAGAPVCERLDNRVCPITEDKIFPQETERLIRELYTKANRSIDGYLSTGDDNFSFAVNGLARFRVSAYRQRGSMAAVVRVVAFHIPNWEELHIPEEVMDLADVTKGMILVTGTAGSGMSTTQACIIDRINRTRQAHIVTLEDPIEYLHRNQRSIVSQREISIDSGDCLAALRACLHQSPDVIFLGEMRDNLTIQTAVSVAESGHVLLSTLPTRGAVNTVERILSAFPIEQRPEVRFRLSEVLNAVVSQQLLPDVRGGQIPAYEILRATKEVRGVIRDGDLRQLNSMIEAGSKAGMITMDQSVLNLYLTQEIKAATAMEYAKDPEQMRRKLR